MSITGDPKLSYRPDHGCAPDHPRLAPNCHKSLECPYPVCVIEAPEQRRADPSERDRAIAADYERVGSMRRVAAMHGVSGTTVARAVLRAQKGG